MGQRARCVNERKSVPLLVSVCVRLSTLPMNFFFSSFYKLLPDIDMHMCHHPTSSSCFRPL